MPKYLIRHRIKTKADCITPFTSRGFKFKHYEFNISEGCLTDYWVAEKEIEEVGYIDAFKQFRKELSELMPRVSFISQCATEFILEPFFILNLEYPEPIIYIRHSKETKTTGLHFDSEEVKNLENLNRLKIDDNFFIFMMESTNSSTGSGRLIMLFCAIESLAQATMMSSCEKCKYKKEFDKADPSILKEILGNKLYGECWGRDGFRHKMAHGTFPKVNEKMTENIYKKIIGYINKKYNLSIHEDVVDPQRSFTGSGIMAQNFYKYNKDLNPEDMDLKNYIEILDKDLNGDKSLIAFIPSREVNYPY